VTVARCEVCNNEGVTPDGLRRCESCDSFARKWERCGNCDVEGLIPPGQTADDCAVCGGTGYTRKHRPMSQEEVDSLEWKRLPDRNGIPVYRDRDGQEWVVAASDTIKLPESQPVIEPGATHAVFVHDDQEHTFDWTSELLARVLRVGESDAYLLAYDINRKGHVCVLEADATRAERVASAITRAGRDPRLSTSKNPLRVSIEAL
jgi:ATP-dependent Clp protease adapter protein ClpS